MNYKITINLKFFSLFFHIKLYKKYVDVIGIHDLIPELAKNIVFLEYDNYELEWIEKELKILQKRFFLSNFIILQSSIKNYHCICFDMLTFNNHQQIIELSNSDVEFKNAVKYDGSRVLRISNKDKKEKPKYLKKIISEYNIWNKSLGHIKVFENLHNIKINKKNAIKTNVVHIIYKTSHL